MKVKENKCKNHKTKDKLDINDMCCRKRKSKITKESGI
jgi:hypothetical protein